MSKAREQGYSLAYGQVEAGMLGIGWGVVSLQGSVDLSWCL